MPIIYKIQRKSNLSCVYVGSTKDTLERRIKYHYQDSKKKSYLLYNVLNSEGWNSFEFVCLEEVTDENRLWKEREYIELLKPSCNIYIPIISEEERKENDRAQMKIWRERTYVCECGKVVTHNNHSRHIKTNYHWKNLSKSI